MSPCLTCRVHGLLYATRPLSTLLIAIPHSGRRLWHPVSRGKWLFLPTWKKLWSRVTLRHSKEASAIKSRMDLWRISHLLLYSLEISGKRPPGSQVVSIGRNWYLHRQKNSGEILFLRMHFANENILFLSCGDWWVAYNSPIHSLSVFIPRFHKFICLSIWSGRF